MRRDDELIAYFNALFDKLQHDLAFARKLGPINVCRQCVRILIYVKRYSLLVESLTR
jgi:hypothetical protein